MEQEHRKKIYTNSRNVIYKLVAILQANLNFTYAETRWWVTKVTPIEVKEQSEVIFIVAARMKELIETQHAIYAKGEHLETAPMGTSQFWRVTINANGIESYYFARLLFMGTMKLSKKQRPQEELDRTLINMYIAEARARTMGLPKKIRTHKDGETYSLSAGGTMSHLFTPFYEIDDLCFYIGSHFKGFVEL